LKQFFHLVPAKSVVVQTPSKLNFRFADSSVEDPTFQGALKVAILSHMIKHKLKIGDTFVLNHRTVTLEPSMIDVHDKKIIFVAFLKS
jgi:hypothetical protein